MNIYSLIKEWEEKGYWYKHRKKDALIEYLLGRVLLLEFENHILSKDKAKLNDLVNEMVALHHDMQ